MNFLTKLFKKKPVVEIPPRPSWTNLLTLTSILLRLVTLSHISPLLSGGQKRGLFMPVFVHITPQMLHFSTFSCGIRWGKRP